jgi:hypothetical protein
MVWDYPVYEPPKQDKEGRTVAKVARQALPADKALAFIAGDDPRPLLVMRECKVCNGTDDALLSRGNIDNEKTILLSRWRWPHEPSASDSVPRRVRLPPTAGALVTWNFLAGGLFLDAFQAAAVAARIVAGPFA